MGKGISTQLTKTKESEYSPNYTPDKKFISCVVVEADSTQRLWLYNTDGTVSRCYNEGIDSIGYYSWLTNDTLLYYKLTEPHSLRIFYGLANLDKWLCNHPSRAFKKINGSTFIYAIKDSLSIQYRIYQSNLKKSQAYALHESRNEDFIWSSELGLLKSEGAQILRYDEKNKSWLVLFDLTSSGVRKITRFTIDEKMKYLVIVDNT